MPVADGGEGTVDCFIYTTSAEKILVEVHGAYNEPIYAHYARIDSQSLGGKAVVGIAQRAKKLDIPVTAIVGSIGNGAFLSYDLGVDAIFCINQKLRIFLYQDM